MGMHAVASHLVSRKVLKDSPSLPSSIFRGGRSGAYILHMQRTFRHLSQVWLVPSFLYACLDAFPFEEALFCMVMKSKELLLHHQLQILVQKAKKVTSIKDGVKSGVVVRACNPSTLEGEAEGLSQVSGQPGLVSSRPASSREWTLV